MPESPARRTRRAFLTDVALGAASCVLAGASHPAGAGGVSILKLPRTHPEAVDIDPAALLAFTDAVNEKVGGLHSFMLLRHGRIAAEAWWAPYGPRSPHMLYSLSKSFTSTAVGLAISEGLLHLDDHLVSFFPDSLPTTVSDNLAAMQLRHMLTMNTGHDQDATGGTTAQPQGDWVRGFLALPVAHAPGTKFVYNSASTYMLSALVQKKTGKTVLDYLTPRLFEPLGIQGPTWETCPRGINCGGWGLSITTEDIARFGQLYLHHGEWQGRQVVPKDWAEQATTRQVPNGNPADASDWSQGYGYQFWRCRHGAFRGDGAFGQFCLVMPDQDAVLAITSGLGDMQAVLNAVWDHLLPGLGSAHVAKSAASRELPGALKKLSIPLPVGEPSSPAAGRISGKTFRLMADKELIEAFTLTFDGDHCRMAHRDSKGESVVECAPDTWIMGTATLEGTPSTKVAARGVWTKRDTYVVTLCFYETPFIQTLTFTLNPVEMTVIRMRNVGFGPTAAPAIVLSIG